MPADAETDAATLEATDQSLETTDVNIGNANTSEVVQDAINSGDVDETYTVEFSNLTQDGQQQVVEGIDEGATAQQALDQAQHSDVMRDTIEHDRADQARDVESGNFAKAEQDSKDSEYAMKTVENEGGHMDPQVYAAERDQLNLDTAHRDQDIAIDNAQTAHSYAAEGDTAHAAQYGETAANAGEAAADHGAAADAGGHYADHSASQASDVAADTTTEA